MRIIGDGAGHKTPLFIDMARRRSKYPGGADKRPG